MKEAIRNESPVIEHVPQRVCAAGADIVFAAERQGAQNNNGDSYIAEGIGLNVIIIGQHFLNYSSSNFD
jgi:hypothetical protein